LTVSIQCQAKILEHADTGIYTVAINIFQRLIALIKRWTFSATAMWGFCMWNEFTTKTKSNE